MIVPPREMSDPQWASNDSVHRVWVSDGNVKPRESEGYRFVYTPSGCVKCFVGGGEIAAYLMEVPQAIYQARISPARGEILGDMRPSFSPELTPDADGNILLRPRSFHVTDLEFGRDDPLAKKEGGAILGLEGDEYGYTTQEWSFWRIFARVKPGRPYIGLFNITKDTFWLRVVVRPKPDAYLYFRLRYAPRFAVWIEWRTRDGDVDRLNAKYPESGN